MCLRSAFCMTCPKLPVVTSITYILHHEVVSVQWIGFRGRSWVKVEEKLWETGKVYSLFLLRVMLCDTHSLAPVGSSHWDGTGTAPSSPVGCVHCLAPAHCSHGGAQTWLWAISSLASIAPSLLPPVSFLLSSVTFCFMTHLFKYRTWIPIRWYSFTSDVHSSLLHHLPLWKT